MSKCAFFSCAARRLTGKDIERGLTKRELSVKQHRKRSYSSLHVSMSVSVLLLFSTANQAFPGEMGAEWNPTGDPIGGGPGYSRVAQAQDADYYVKNRSELLSAISVASFGDVIYVADSAVISMDGMSMAIIEDGVTLASGRGQMVGDTISWGALVYLDDIVVNRGSLFRTDSRARITGLRLRGPYSECEGGRAGTDIFPGMSVVCYAVSLHGDHAELDNCEIWGFARGVIANGGDSVYVHHNYLPTNHHCSGGGYGILTGSGNTRVIIEANLLDFHSGPIIGAGANAQSEYAARYNIILEHAYHNAFDRHGNWEGGTDPDSTAQADYIHHNTVRYNAYVGGNVTGVWIRGYPVDSVWIHNNWFWDQDSSSSIRLWQNSNFMCRIWDNHFTTTPPQGLAARLPIAMANASVESGVVPLVVTFNANGSYDPDGNIRACYWKFGEDAYARYADMARSVEHVFEDIGMYRVELMVTDDDGIPSKDWIDIDVAPDNDSSYLSVWVKDRYHDGLAGYWKKQILVDGDLIWEDDVAGDEGWIHVVENVTDHVAGKDSVDLTFRVYCQQSTSSGQFHDLWTYWDDVVLYGGDVRNGNFESGVWSGYPWATDGNWICTQNYVWLRGWDVSREVRSGNSAYMIGPIYSHVGYQSGNWIKVAQKVAVGTSAGSSYFDSEGNGEIFMSLPYPNPSRRAPMVEYGVSTQTRVLMRIYDVCGRRVRTLIDDVQGAGPYRINWDTRDDHGNLVASGVYFCRLHAINENISDSYIATQSLVVLR